MKLSMNLLLLLALLSCNSRNELTQKELDAANTSMATIIKVDEFLIEKYGYSPVEQNPEMIDKDIKLAVEKEASLEANLEFLGALDKIITEGEKVLKLKGKNTRYSKEDWVEFEQTLENAKKSKASYIVNKERYVKAVLERTSAIEIEKQMSAITGLTQTFGSQYKIDFSTIEESDIVERMHKKAKEEASNKKMDEPFLLSLNELISSFEKVQEHSGELPENLAVIFAKAQLAKNSYNEKYKETRSLIKDKVSKYSSMSDEELFEKATSSEGIGECKVIVDKDSSCCYFLKTRNGEGYPYGDGCMADYESGYSLGPKANTIENLRAILTGQQELCFQ